MRKSIKIIAVIAALPMLLLAGCAPAEKTGPELIPVTVVLDWTPNTNHTGLYAALKNGYYAENGLEVSIIQPPEDGALPLVASNQAQFGVSFQESLALALTADEPLPVKAVAAIIQHNTSGILSLKEKGISSPKLLEGKSYATWDIPVELAVMDNVMALDGGDFSKVNLIHSTVTDVLTALQTDVDAVWVFYAWDGIAAEVKGLQTNYFEFAQINPALDFYTPILVSSSEFLESSPDTAKAFLEATARGYEYAIESPAQAADILLEYAPELDADIVRASQEYLASRYKAEETRWGYIDPSRWDRFYGWLWENELLPSEIGHGEGFTNEFLPEQ